MEFQCRTRRRYVLWVMVGVQLLVRNLQGTAAQTDADKDFINIDCGAPAGIQYRNTTVGITFESDVTMIFTGETATTGDGNETDLSTLRYFPAASSPRKNCYDVPVDNNQQYLARAWFHFGGYTAPPASGIKFKLAVDETVWKIVSVDTASNASTVFEEVIFISSKGSVSICLIRMDNSGDPFINTLELRPITASFSYIKSLPTEDRHVMLRLLDRRNFGELKTTYRYPVDDYDRIWPPWPNASAAGVTSLYTQQQLTFDASGDPQYDYDYFDYKPFDYPPSAVMQSAMTHPRILDYSFTLDSSDGMLAYVWLFFAEINNTINNTEPTGLSRVMNIYTNIDTSPDLGYNLTSFPPFDVRQYGYFNQPITAGQSIVEFKLTPNGSKDLPPLVNAFEAYQLIPLGPPTNPDDVTALAAVKQALNYSRWTGYPCNPVSWDEIICTGNAVTSLDLSAKNLSFTSVPSGISGLNSLAYLNLSNNQFFGPLPPLEKLPPSLKTLDVSNNNFSDDFPATYLAKFDFRYSGNDQLRCVPSGNAVCEPGGSAPSSKPKSRSPIGPIVGGIVGGALLLLLIIFLYIWLCYRNKRAPTREAKLLHLNPDGGPTVQSSQASNASQYPRWKAQPYALSTLIEATNNFARKIGEGGFGPVYYGKLKDKEVAVKVMSARSQQGLSEYSNEIDLLSTVHYKKLVSLVGYCEEAKELILLYEYMPGGDLRARLYGGDAAQQSPLTWRQRLQIALDAAKGLEYLHFGCNPAIFHRDVKSSNILLSSKLEAKVADFGLSKLINDGQTHVMTTVKGTLGYLDPGYNATGLLTDKSDVYSFGVVLLEMLCGHPPILQSGPYRFIVEKVRAAMNTGSLLAVIDPALRGDFKVESVWRFAEIAMSCVSQDATARPTMSKVVWKLCEALKAEGPERPGLWLRLTSAKYADDDAETSSSCSLYKMDEPSQIFYTDPTPR